MNGTMLLFCTECYCKSDTKVDIMRKEGQIYNTKNKRNYKKYELEETPVRDHAEDSSKSEECGKGDRESSLEPSLDLDELEVKIYNNLSQELQIDSSYSPSLESNIKLFKTAVQEIFDSFYASMRDFEYYKRRFEEILSKSNEDSIAEMEGFIIDMIQHIRSNSSNGSTAEKDDCSVSNESRVNLPFEGSNDESSKECKPTIEVCRNDHYNSDTLSGLRSSSDVLPDKVFDGYNFSGNRCVRSLMNNRDILSEIILRDSSMKEDVVDEATSADNMQKLRAKELELARLRRQSGNEQVAEKEIPVKLSNPKKNIHLDEDFAHDNLEELEQSIFHKICRYLCRKLRKC